MRREATLHKKLPTTTDHARAVSNALQALAGRGKIDVPDRTRGTSLNETTREGRGNKSKEAEEGGGEHSTEKANKQIGEIRIKYKQYIDIYDMSKSISSLKNISIYRKYRDIAHPYVRQLPEAQWQNK